MDTRDTGNLTELLSAANSGDQDALDQLTPLIYEDLKRLASAHMRSENARHTLQTTGLVHEAFFKLLGEGRPPYQSRQHFLAVASTVMRHVLVSWARRKNAAKRGGRQEVLPLDEGLALGGSVDPVTVLAVHDCLDRLGEMSEQAARVVECRFFAGLSVVETADALQVSESTIKRQWRTARAWLQAELSDRPGAESR